MRGDPDAEALAAAELLRGPLVSRCGGAAEGGAGRLEAEFSGEGVANRRCRRRALVACGSILFGLACGGSTLAVAQTSQPSEGGRIERAGSPGKPGVLDATGEEDAQVSGPNAAAKDASARRGFGTEPFLPTAGDEGGGQENENASQMGPLVTVTSSLAIVLGLFGGLVWLVRRSGGKASTQLPEEVFSLLGRTTLGPRQTISLARCGRRILVLAVSPGTTTTLAEITDPDEVADLVAQCGNGGARQLFQRTLQEMGERGP